MDSDEIRRGRRSPGRGGREGKLPLVGGLAWAGTGFHHVRPTALWLPPTAAGAGCSPRPLFPPSSEPELSFLLQHIMKITFAFQLGVATMGGAESVKSLGPDEGAPRPARGWLPGLWLHDRLRSLFLV